MMCAYVAHDMEGLRLDYSFNRASIVDSLKDEGFEEGIDYTIVKECS